jgi:hypothetical protein
MGYYSYVSDEITIDPPIPWGEFEIKALLRSNLPPGEQTLVWHTPAAYEIRENVWGIGATGTIAYGDVALQYTVVNTPTGPVRQIDAIVPAEDEPSKLYHLEVSVADIAADFAVDTDGNPRAFFGYLEVDGEERDDLWRIHILKGKAVRVDSEIHWPEPRLQETDDQPQDLD